MTTADEQSDVLNDDSGIDLDLKNPFVAALLAWIVPGLAACCKQIARLIAVHCKIDGRAVLVVDARLLAG